MDCIVPVARFTVPLGGQQVELQHVRYAAGSLSFLRIRIREGSRFTVLDIDPATAAELAFAMQAWARTQADPAIPEEQPT